MLDTDLSQGALLADPAFYAGDPFPTYQWLHEHAPVHRTHEPAFWTISKHDDCRKVSQNATLFSVEHGLVINDVKFQAPLLNGAFRPEHGTELLPTTDGPRHAVLRRHSSPGFSPKRINAIEPNVRAMVVNLLEGIEDGVPFDFVRDIAGPLPLMVIRDLLGLHDLELADMWRWTDQVFKLGEGCDEEELRQVSANLADMYEYFGVQIDEHRRAPGEDVLSMLLGSEVDGERVSEANLLMFLQVMLVAGNETTRNLLSGAIRAMTERPTEWPKLRADPTLAANATEEFLRFVTPSIGHVRTAMADTTIRDEAIAEGDKVFVLYAAANRDAEVYAEPDTLDVSRRFSGQHMAFGFGPHACLGAPLARLESRVFFEELAPRFRRFELAGEPVRLQSTFANGHRSLPVTFWR
jgi:cytochrome P450